MPLRSRRPSDTRADIAECRVLLRGGSKTFYIASLLLPEVVRAPASALYAFCRLADDEVDLLGQTGAVERLRERLKLVYAGLPLPHPADRALADIVEEFGLPYELLDTMLEGFEWDCAGRRYDDFSGLCDYAARVAGSVGAAMAVLMGARDPDQLARATDLGVAMQLSNIARDIGEDARNGRIYLPLSWLRQEGIDPDAWLRNPAFDPALGRVVARLLAEADVLYARASSGVARLPRPCRTGIGAARLMYAEIGHQVARQGFNSIETRAVVPAGRKLWLLACSEVQSWWPMAAGSHAALPQTQYLVDAVLAHPAPRPIAAEGTSAWLYNLFSRLEGRDVGVARAL